MKLNKLLTAIAVVTPTVALIPATSCNKKSQEFMEAEEYIKNRTFGIAGLDSDNQWVVCGTAWVISDSTENSSTDYNYWIATNWHVQHDITKGEYPRTIKSVGFHYDGMGDNVYQKFANISWEDQSQFEFDEESTDKAIDFYVANVNFANSASELPAIAQTRLDNLNQYKKDHGYINKFVKSNSSSNFTKKDLYCAGYPARKVGSNILQQWNVEHVAANSDVKWYNKDTVYLTEYAHAGHIIDDKTMQIWDVSANYYYNAMFECYYDDDLGNWIPYSWTLSGGASGSMLVTKQNNEMVVVGIYWGGWQLADTKQENVYFCPAWSMFKSDDKNFIEDYE